MLLRGTEMMTVIQRIYYSLFYVPIVEIQFSKKVNEDFLVADKYTTFWKTFWYLEPNRSKGKIRIVHLNK